VNEPAPNLTNATGTDQIAIIGFAITNITFSNSGGAIAIIICDIFCSDCVYAKSPYLSWNTTNGTSCIVNTRAHTVYTVTAKNATDNTDSAVFSLTVNAPAPNLTNATGVVLLILKPAGSVGAAASWFEY
jgi:hypothetical protein